MTFATKTTIAALLTTPAFANDFKVVTTFTVIADMARNVAGDAAVVESTPVLALKSMATNRRRAIWCVPLVRT